MKPLQLLTPAKVFALPLALFLLLVGLSVVSVILISPPQVARGAPLLQTPPVPPFSGCGNVAEIPTTECDALVALYNDTAGPNWLTKTNWLLTNTPCTWYGVTCFAGRVDALDLPGNQLTGPLPPQLGNLTEMRRLLLDANQLSGSIPLSLTGLINLNGLFLNINNLSGPLPVQLGNLTNLSSLGLSGNQFSGALPPELGNLQGLGLLYLGDNQLSGIIPTQLVSLTNLVALDLSANHHWRCSRTPTGTSCQSITVTIRPPGNQLTGAIPAGIGNFTRLQLLILAANRLSGSLPPELGNLGNLLVLDAAGNQLTGPIPTQLGNLSSLVRLWLFDNQLSEPIPTELGQLTNLLRLDLSNNQLSGPIPPVLGSLPNLFVLNLSGNQLDSTIPAELGALANLQTLNVSANQLRGVIPSALVNLTRTTAVDVNYNALRATDPAVSDWLNRLDPGWANTQTVPPTQLQAAVQADGGVQLTWRPISYTADGGYYQVLQALSPNGPYGEVGRTSAKTSTGFLVAGLTTATPYAFLVRTFTPAHGQQQNNLLSEDSVVVSTTLTAGLALTKTPATPTILIGADAVFTLQVVNTGMVTLNNVAVSDPLTADCVRNLGALAPGASQTYRCTQPAVLNRFSNVATVTGTPPVGAPVNATVQAEVNVRVPTVLLTPLAASGIVGQEHSITATVRTDPAAAPTLRVRALIDGRSQLILQGDTIRWRHFDFAAPGRHLGADEPTLLNGTAWRPVWLGGNPPEHRDCQCDSQPTGVPLLIAQPQIVITSVLQARGGVTLIQPSRSNQYTLILEFNDNTPANADWYEVALTYVTTPDGPSVPRQPVSFTVAGGNNTSGGGLTDSTGEARFTYPGLRNIAATDTITAWLEVNANGLRDAFEPADTAVVSWRPITLTVQGKGEGTDHAAVRTITATLQTAEATPEPVGGLQVRLAVTGANSATGSLESDINGRAIFTYTSTAPRASSTLAAAEANQPAQPSMPAATDVLTVWADLNRNGQLDAGEPLWVEEVPSAITLAAFTAQVEGEQVTLRWVTAVEIDNAGFNLYRAASPAGPYVRLNDQLIAGQGTGTGASYSLDDRPDGPGPFYYKLEDIDYNGVSTLHGPLTVWLATSDANGSGELYLPLVQR